MSYKLESHNEEVRHCHIGSDAYYEEHSGTFFSSPFKFRCPFCSLSGWKLWGHTYRQWMSG